MSVIGRLDNQVNEKLIEPLARKHQQETNEQREKTKTLPVTTEIEVEAPKRETKRNDLPVWLL
jgi:hypothetical protein